MRRACLCGIATLLAGCALLKVAAGAASPVLPRVVGDWWQIAGNPNLGSLTSERQQPVDFAIWPAADGTWQLWSCIRNTKEVGRTRLFHRWEGAALHATNWRSLGIALRADPARGEQPGGMQAPYVFRAEGRFVMFYGDWANICAQESADGKVFTRRLNPAGQSALFGGDPERNTRDPMVLRTGGRWICYYTAHPQKKGAVYARTSMDLRRWEEEVVVAEGGADASDPRFAAECPFVVERRPGEYFLFSTQRYRPRPQTTVTYSQDPLDFRSARVGARVLGTLPVAAPEVFEVKGDWYVAALLPDLTGIRVARLAWE